MVIIVIAGVTLCKPFSHACYLGSYLTNHLPNFRMHTIVKRRSEWKMWLQIITSKNNWKHKACPIIWHEPAMRGGQAVLIGDLSSFMEYCREYYGIFSFLTKDEEEILIRGDMKEWKEEIDRAITWRRVRTRRSLPSAVVVGLSMGSLPIARVTSAALLEIPSIAQVLIYEEDGAKVKQVVEECSYSLNGSVHLIDSLETTMRHTRLLLIMNIPGAQQVRDKNTPLFDWLSNLVFWTLKLVEKMRSSIPEDCRVLLTAPTRDWPLCLLAAVFAEALADRINPRNVVAVTADLGMEELSRVAAQLSVPTSCLLAPPVWGFVGLNRLVDVESATVGAAWIKPNARAKKNIPNSTLPQGQWIVQLRKMLYKFTTNCKNWDRAKDDIPFESKHLLKLRSIMVVLQLWFSEKPSSGQVISLGLFSDGTNSIPEWLFWSQPAFLDSNGIWMPSKEVPPPIGSEPIKMVHLIPLAVYLSAYFGLGIYLKAPWAAIKMTKTASEHRQLTFVDAEKAVSKDKDFHFEDLEYYKMKAFKELGRTMVLAEAEMIWVPRAMDSAPESLNKGQLCPLEG